MRLNIFIDETGDFGINSGSRLYGLSFTFHEQKDNIGKEIIELNTKLEKIGYTKMIHMADLISKRGDYEAFSINERVNIFNCIYHFARKVPVRYYSIFVDKNYTIKRRNLKRELTYNINKMIKNNKKYFNKFTKIVIYYDNGQEILTDILKSCFSKMDSYEHNSDFDKKEKRLFQVSDMLTFIDKYDYKVKNKIPLTSNEKYFLSIVDIRKVLKKLEKKRFK